VIPCEEVKARFNNIFTRIPHWSIYHHGHRYGVTKDKEGVTLLNKTNIQCDKRSISIFSDNCEHYIVLGDFELFKTRIEVAEVVEGEMCQIRIYHGGSVIVIDIDSNVQGA